MFNTCNFSNLWFLVLLKFVKNCDCIGSWAEWMLNLRILHLLPFFKTFSTKLFDPSNSSAELRALSQQSTPQRDEQNLSSRSTPSSTKVSRRRSKSPFRSFRFKRSSKNEEDNSDDEGIVWFLVCFSFELGKCWGFYKYKNIWTNQQIFKLSTNNWYYF